MAQNNLPSRKKILFLITKATWGGAQKYVYDLATHLPKDQFDPIVAYGTKGKLAEKLTSAAIEGYSLPALGRDVALVSDISGFFQILTCLRKTRPDVIHLNSSKAAALGVLAARLSGVRRIIFTVHGWPFNEKRNEFARVLIYIVSWFTAFLSHAVIVVSKSDEVQGGKMRWIGKKVHYIPIGIEPPQFLSREEARRVLNSGTRCLNWAADDPHIVTIAELTANKGLQYAIEAIARLKDRDIDAVYTIIGEGEERVALEEYVQKLGLADCVTFTGFLPDASQYLRAFDIFLLPSIKEGMPYVLLEAAQAGLPIVTTDVVNPDVINQLPNLRAVSPADPEAIADALAEMTQGQRTGLGQNHFSLSNMLQKTVALYQ